ncbi:DUF5591 domain-containing protein [Candidatus Lokiarchaeum ossiferum]|uniref:DUF5591 domain-containing protein n=1 Tax=Candidatus Lokiarchaeum ossiferum TaxID=2951803 RepID=UPI00352C98EE
MKKTRFEIKKQMGLTRKGRITFGEKSFSTPNLIFPTNQNLINKIDPSTILLPDNIIGYHIEDPLHILDETTPKNLKSDCVLIAHQTDLFTTSNDIFGIPKSLNALFEDPLQELEHIPILSEIYPNTNTNRYLNYEVKSLEHRLKLYSEVLFSKAKDQKFIVEFNFKQEKEFLPLIIEWINENITHILGIQLSNLFKNLMNATDILHWIFTLKQKIPSDLIWILGGQIFPQDYALALYLGFDLIDARTIFQWSMKGMYIGSNSRQWIRELQHPLCSCNFCSNLYPLMPIHGELAIETQSNIFNHNLLEMVGEFRRIHQYFTDATFRTYLEAKIHSSPLAGSLLKLIDVNYAAEINSRYPLINTHPVMCIGAESYTRPEISNFINRVKKEVTPSRAYPMAIVLPCSAKKPYSQSKSHQRFQKTIKRATGKYYTELHQVIITSPTGVIPRELERVFPAAHYDIPVTGSWDETEVRSTGEALALWILKYPAFQIPSETQQDESMKIVAHLSGGYKLACQYAETLIKKTHPKFAFHYTIDGNTHGGASSDSTLSILQEWLQKNRTLLEKNYPQSKAERMTRLTEDEIIIRATFDYQFGKGAGDLISDRGAVMIKGRWPQFNEVYVYDGAGKLLVGRYYMDSGLFKLAPLGAELLLDHNRNFVKINEEDLRGTTVFKPILASLDETAHPDDDVVVIDKNGEYLGVGELNSSPQDILSALHGKVCKMRKKIKRKKKGTPSADLALLKEIEGDD